MFRNSTHKPDSRVRFQNSRFKSQLRRAREYKRSGRAKPKTSVEIFLSKIGLGSWFSRFATLLVFLLLIYIVFIPNIFFVSKIIINPPQPETLSLTNSFLDQKLPWPQKNLILLSKNKLTNYLEKNNQKILSVTVVTKKFPSTLIINLTPRVDEFTIQTPSSTYFSLANDGLVTSELFLNASGTLPNTLSLIKLDNSDGLVIGRSALSQNQIDFLNRIGTNLTAIANSPISYFEISALTAPDLTVIFKSGLKILLNTTSDPSEVMNRLKLLFTQFSGTELNTLDYIDMRFGDNGYVCYKGAACVQQTAIPSTSASSTATGT